MLTINLKDKSVLRVPNYTVERLEKQLGIDKNKETIIILSPTYLTFRDKEGKVVSMMYMVIRKDEIKDYKYEAGGEEE